MSSKPSSVCRDCCSDRPSRLARVSPAAVQARTLGAGGGTPARHAAAGAGRQAALPGERQGLDVPGELHGGLQLQKHNVVVMVQVGGAALVPRVGDSSGHLPHLLASLHARQDVLAQVHSVPSAGARSRWSEGSRSSVSSRVPSLTLPRPTALLPKVSASTPSTPVPSKASAGTPFPHPHVSTKPRAHPMPITTQLQPHSQVQLRPRTTPLTVSPHPLLPQAPHTPLDSALR